MKSIVLVGTCGVLAAFAFTTAPSLPKQGAVAISQLTLDRAVRVVAPISGGGSAIPFPAVKGVVITEIAMEPRNGLPNLQDAVGVQFDVAGMTQTTACFLPEQWNNSSGQRCNTRDRRIQFDPPIVVPPGNTLTLTLWDQDQMTLQWSVAAPTTVVNFSLAGYFVLPGEV